MQYNHANNAAYAGVMELVDVVDSKSTACKGVPVRVRPPVPQRASKKDARCFLSHGKCLLLRASKGLYKIPARTIVCL